MPGFIQGMAKRAQLAAYASRDERSPGPQYGPWTGQEGHAACKKLGVGCVDLTGALHVL